MRRSFTHLLMMLFVMLQAAQSAALEIALVVPQRNGAHAQLVEALQTSLRVAGHTLRDGGNLADGLAGANLDSVDLVVASGFAAAEAVVERHATPTLAVLVSRSHYLELRRRHPTARLSAIVLDQPPERQLALLRAVLPHGRTVGVLFGPESGLHIDAFGSAADRADFELYGKHVAVASDLMPAIKQSLESADALIALADPLLSSSTAARSLLLSSYRYRRPVLAYSQAYVDAGALAAVFSRPGDIALDVVDWVSETHDLENHVPQARAPRHFDIAINHRVARALNLDVADAATILARMLKETGE